MGLLGNIIAKGVATAATKSIIKTVGDTTIDVMVATVETQAHKEDVVEKKGKLYIKPTRSSEDYINESAFDVVQELLGVGFQSVTLKSVKKLNERAVKKYGRIKSISINGCSEFLGIKRVPASSHIVIEFLDFREDVNLMAYSNVKHLKEGRIQSVDDIEVSYPEIKPVNNPKKSFCPYCGEKILNENAKFCAVCGKEI